MMIDCTSVFTKPLALEASLSPIELIGEARDEGAPLETALAR